MRTRRSGVRIPAGPLNFIVPASFHFISSRVLRIGNRYYTVRRAVIFLILMLPLAWAKWQIYVSPGMAETTIYGYADSQGCISVISGQVSTVKYFVGDGIEELNNAGDYFCIPEDTIFSISATSAVTIAMPLSSVNAEDNPLAPVKISDFGSRTIVEVDSYYSAALPLLILALLLIIAYFWIFRYRKARPASKDEAVIEYIAKHPGCTQKEICNALGLEKYQVSRILARLEQRGIIVRVKRGISKRVYLKEQLQ